MKNTNTLSVVINTKNESINIKSCIDSISELADEIIVCDMNSNDNTLEIAKSLGAKTISVNDYGYVEPARMKAIKKSKSNWIMILDADERISKFLLKKIRKYLLSPKYNIVSFPRKNLMFGYWNKHGMRWPDYQIRLFKKGCVKFSKKIHSQPIVKEEIYKFPSKKKFAILHNHSLNAEQLLIKTWQQASKENFYQNQPFITPKLIRERVSNEIDWRFIEHHGYEDGIPGYISAKFMEFYRFLEFVSFWEKNKELKFNSIQARQLVEKKKQESSLAKLIKKIKKLF